MAARARETESVFIGRDYGFLLEGVAARAAIDFGGTISLEGLRLLSRISGAAVRNAVSVGELHPDARGHVAAEEARAWLARRRDFCPSRWKDPNDNQWPLDPVGAAKHGTVWVPRDIDGVPFTPEHVVRRARRGAGLSITVGAKGKEQQCGDFYQALSALAQMRVARWRRRNSAGNWGIVRARGAWVAIGKADISRQLEAKLAEIA